MSFTLVGHIISMVKSIKLYINDYEYVSDTLYSNEFATVLRQYLHMDVKKDWIGRLYGIINPIIDIDGKLDINNAIIEINGENSNNNEQVQHWAYKQLTLIGQLFKIENLYNYIDLTFKHVGPIEADNYLLIFDMVSRKQMSHDIKRALYHATIYGLIVLGILLII